MKGSSTWSRVGSDGQIIFWSVPHPAEGSWSGYDSAADGGLFAVGCSTDYCFATPETERIIARLGPEGAVRWMTSLPWDGVAGWEFEAVQELPDGGAIAVGGFGNRLYERSPDDHTVVAARFDADGSVVWDRTYPGWGRVGEIVGLGGVQMRVDENHIEVLLRHFDPHAGGQGPSTRHAALVLSTDGEVLSRSDLGAVANGRLVRLERGRWVRAAHGGDAGCWRSTCSGNRTLQVEILR